ncbi:unnamed protein product, partial [marine sediment metagenome]
SLIDWFTYFGQAPPKEIKLLITDKDDPGATGVIVLPKILFNQPEILRGVLAERLYRFLSYTYLSQEQVCQRTEEYLLWDYFQKFDPKTATAQNSIIQKTIEAEQFDGFNLIPEQWFEDFHLLNGALKVLRGEEQKLTEEKLQVLLNFILEGYRHPKDKFNQHGLLRKVYLAALNDQTIETPRSILPEEEVSLKRPVAPFRCMAVLRVLYAIKKTGKPADWNAFFAALEGSKNEKISYLHAYQKLPLNEHLNMAKKLLKADLNYINYILALHHLGLNLCPDPYC